MNRLIPLTLALVGLASLTACQTKITTAAVPATATTPAVPATTTTVSTDPLTALVNKIATIAIPDLTAAAADATNHGDTVAAQCYNGLIPIVKSVQANPPITLPGTAPIGLATTFQDARDIKNGVSSLPSALKSLREQINLACGALQIDVQAGIADPLGLFSGY